MFLHLNSDQGFTCLDSHHLYLWALAHCLPYAGTVLTSWIDFVVPFRNRLRLRGSLVVAQVHIANKSGESGFEIKSDKV